MQLKQLVLSLVVLSNHGFLFSQPTAVKRPAFAIKPALLQASQAGGYDPGKPDRINLFQQKATVRDIFRLLRQRMDFLLSPDAFELSLRRDICRNNVTLAELLQYLQTQYPITIELNNGQYLVDRKPFRISGFIFDSLHHPLPGASISVAETDLVIPADSNGHFSFMLKKPGRLVFTHAGKRPLQQKIAGDTVLGILMEDIAQVLPTAMISPCYHDGFQSISATVATGAYDRIDMEAMSRNPAPTITGRLTGLLPSFSAAAGAGQGSSLPALRGVASIYGNPYTLIIVDGFPFDASTDHISLYDIDNITVMKDAGAGAIWGSQAANGVLSINTRKGLYRKGLQVSLAQQLSIGEKPDNHYQQGPAAADFVDMEMSIYEKLPVKAASGFSPVQDILVKRDQGQISAARAGQLLSRLRAQDTRGETSRYLQQQGLYQQYALSVSTGAPAYRFYGSFDASFNRMNNKGNYSGRLSSLMNFSLQQKNFEASISAGFSGIQARQNALALPSTQPYLAFTDSAGRPASIPYQYPIGLTEQLTDHFLDWHYYPLQEAALADNRTSDKLFRFGAHLQYKFLRHLRAAFSYQYTYAAYDQYNSHATASYFTRALVNLYRQNEQGVYSWKVPDGSIEDRYQLAGPTNHCRGQLQADYVFGRFSLKGIAGIECQAQDLNLSASRIYGKDLGIPQSSIDFTDFFPLAIPGMGSAQIPYINAQRDSANHFIGYYFYGLLTWKDKFTFSASLRRDQSNRFALQTNRRGMPLWSVGGGWTIKEGLRLRTSYGVTGNIDYTTAPFTSIQPVPGTSASPIFTIAQPGDEALSWERQYMLNTGLEFRLKNGGLRGSIDYYRKHADHLLQLRNANPTSGYSLLKDNSGVVRGEGVDIQLQTAFIRIAGEVEWSASLLYAYSHNQLVSQQAGNVPAWQIRDPSARVLRPGEPLAAVYAFQMTGLDHHNGGPLGQLYGRPSQDYTAILQNTTAGALVYAGSGVPTSYGSLTQSFRYKRFLLSVMLTGKGGYVMRKPGLRYYSMYFAQDGGTPDYYRRWEKPGDEQHTQVPSLPATLDPDRDQFYAYSTASIIRADHIRAEYAQLGYRWDRYALDFTVWHPAILWRANKWGIDPDAAAGGLPASRSYTISFKAIF